MATPEIGYLKTQLQERKKRLETTTSDSGRTAELGLLLAEVDAALARVEQGTYGICESCHDSIEKERLLTDPLVRFCLDHLTTEEQRRLEEDLELAARIQRALLPQQDLRVDGWHVHYHYDPAGLVSGDYCDLIRSEGSGDLYFLLGDVAGKGVAASMLMSHLHAMFRSLTSVGLPLEQLMTLADRVFCESTMAGQYATLVCGRAARAGEVELFNAGHLPALLVRPNEVTRLGATGLPLGMFGKGPYSAKKLKLGKGESLLLYTDGLSEARDRSGAEYGIERLAQFVGQQSANAPQALAAACLKEVKAYSAGAPRGDDLTLMVLQRAG